MTIGDYFAWAGVVAALVGAGALLGAVAVVMLINKTPMGPKF